MIAYKIRSARMPTETGVPSKHLYQKRKLRKYMLASLTESDRLRLTRIADGIHIVESKLRVRKLSAPVHFAFHPTRRLIAAGTEYGIHVFDMQTGEQVARLK